MFLISHFTNEVLKFLEIPKDNFLKNSEYGNWPVKRLVIKVN